MVLTNVYGVALTIRATLPHLLERGDGHFLITSSVAGRRALPGSLYSATKWAATAIGEALRAELRQMHDNHGIRVTLIEPGMTDTEFFDNRPGDSALQRRRHRPRGDLRPRAAARGRRQRDPDPPHAASRSRRARYFFFLWCLPLWQAGTWSFSFFLRSFLPFCDFSVDLGGELAGAEVGGVQQQALLAALDGQHELADRDVGDRVEDVAEAAALDRFGAGRAGARRPGRGGRRAGRAGRGSRGPGRPAPSAPCRAAARSPSRCRRSSSSGRRRRPAAAACRSFLMWLWSRIRALGRVTTACRRLASPSRPTRVARNFGFCARTVDLRPLMTLVKSLRAELEGAAIGGLERREDREGAERGFGGRVGAAALERPGRFELAAAGRVDREFLAVGVDVDRADVELGAAEDVRDLVRVGPDLGRFGIDEQRHPDDDRRRGRTGRRRRG